MSITRVDDKNFHSLVERLNNGDETAFEEICKSAAPPFLSCAKNSATIKKMQKKFCKIPL